MLVRREKKGRVYRALGLSSAYVRTRGFEPIQVEAMMYQFVLAHDKITRAEAAEPLMVVPGTYMYGGRSVSTTCVRVGVN
jgi:hypothetical protein